MPDRLSHALTPLPLEEEWRVLLCLAQAPSPAAVCRASNWRGELFSSPQTQEALSRLLRAERSVALPLPPALDGLVPCAQEELPALRARMAYAALFTRLLPSYQSNLRDRLLTVLDATVPGGGDVEALLTRMMEETLRGMDASLTALKEVFSPQAAAQVKVATQEELDQGYWERIGAMKAAAPTGFRGLDRMLSGGLHPERFFVILGAPGAGKTTLAHQIAEYAASRGRPTVYLACEESPVTLYAKTLSRLGCVDYTAVQFGWATYRAQIEAARVLANERLSARRLLYVEGFSSLAELSEGAKDHFQRYSDEGKEGGPGLLVVDYLQCIAQILARSGSQGGNTPENQLISLLCYDLRALAKALHCTVLAISRQNRASGYGNSNALTSGSGSGGIEYGADVVMCIDKDEDRKAPPGWKGRSLVIPKNRLGEADTRLLLDWRGKYQEFREATRGGDDHDRC